MKKDKQLYKDLLFGFTLATEVFGSFILGVVIGLYVDDYFNTKPIFILIGLLLAFIHVMKLLLRLGKNK